MPMEKFAPVRDNRSHSDKIIEQITDALLRGDIKPGERLPPERDLALQFSVSRTVVRDAVKNLAGRGILEVRHGSGIYVAADEKTVFARLDQVNLQDGLLRDLFEVRKVLETEAASLAAARRTERQVEHLRHIIHDARLHAGDPALASSRDADFHLTLAKASRNLILVKLMLTVLDLLAPTRERTLSINGRLEQSLREHERIVGAIAASDAAGARAAMLAHLDSVEQSIDRLQQAPVS
jgi:GntR family transcriptional regulator, transcriptional repressor for pyruvate dehydrogenase complex